MKKITLKCYSYSYRDPGMLLMQAANILATKTKTHTLTISTRTKSATINVAEPLLALAAADLIRRKTGVVVIVAALPTNVVHFVKFLKERGLLEEWCKGIGKRPSVKSTLAWLSETPANDWLICAFVWGDSEIRRQAHNEWQTYILENNL